MKPILDPCKRESEPGKGEALPPPVLTNRGIPNYSTICLASVRRTVVFPEGITLTYLF